MSSSGFHEDFKRTADEPKASERSFGLVFSAVFALVAFLPLLDHHPVRWWSVVVAAAFLTLALAAPRVLAFPNLLWMKLGKLLHMIVSPVVMSALFIVAVVATAVSLAASQHAEALDDDGLRAHVALTCSYHATRAADWPAGESLAQAAALASSAPPSATSRERISSARSLRSRSA